MAVFVIPIRQSLFRLQRSGLGHGPPKTVFAGRGKYAQVFAAFSPLAGLGARAGAEVDFLFSIGNIVTWSWAGYNRPILYTALQSIPRELFEAAEVDVAPACGSPGRSRCCAQTGVFSIIGWLRLFGEPTA
ncbi:hypothetical protein ABT294_34480 [Nonomuraea sp. NPDC000554]|uniref:hypothetical protein n=1 Tax=Nonomuraea sp. NPDC000554 TaxID=3154259 RepID=UPI003321ACE4